MSIKKVVCEIVNGCHLSCPLCYRGLDGHGDYRNMDLQILEQALNKSIELLGEARGILFEVYNWGEPLLHRCLPEVGELIRRYGVRSCISTNFSLRIKQEKFEALLKSFDHIIISCSGLTPKTYSVYHRGGNIDLVLSNLETLINMRRRLKTDNIITLSYGLHVYNSQEVEHARQFCAEREIHFNPLRLYLTTVEDILAGRNIDTSIYIGRPQSKGITSCPIIDWVVIGVEGDFLLCCGTKNVKTGYTVYDDISLNELTKIKSRLPLCRECQEKKIYKEFL